MRYECRPGIVYCKICGESLLIPTRSASELCPEIIRLSMPAMIVWKTIDQNKPLDKVKRLFKILMHSDDDDAGEAVLKIINDFKERGLIIEFDE